MLWFWRICRIVIVIIFLWSLPYLLFCVAGVIEGTFEVYDVSLEQIQINRRFYMLCLCVIAFFDSIVVLLFVLAGRRIKKIKKLQRG